MFVRLRRFAGGYAPPPAFHPTLLGLECPGHLEASAEGRVYLHIHAPASCAQVSASSSFVLHVVVTDRLSKTKRLGSSALQLATKYVPSVHGGR